MSGGLDVQRRQQSQVKCANTRLSLHGTRPLVTRKSGSRVEMFSCANTDVSNFLSVRGTLLILGLCRSAALSVDTSFRQYKKETAASRYVDPSTIFESEPIICTPFQNLNFLLFSIRHSCKHTSASTYSILDKSVRLTYDVFSNGMSSHQSSSRCIRSPPI